MAGSYCKLNESLEKTKTQLFPAKKGAFHKINWVQQIYASYRERTSARPHNKKIHRAVHLGLDQLGTGSTKIVITPKP